MNNIRVNELHEAALQQQRENYQHSIESLEAIIGKMMPGIIDLEDEMPYPVFVLTLDNDVHGASAILQPEVLIAVEEMQNGDFFIVPSSIHEVMIIPDLGIDRQEQDLNEIVRSANKWAVDPEDRLSDKVIRASEFLRIIDPPERKMDRGYHL